jgi:hypothetical protein
VDHLPGYQKIENKCVMALTWGVIGIFVRMFPTLERFQYFPNSRITRKTARGRVRFILTSPLVISGAWMQHNIIAHRSS